MTYGVHHADCLGLLPKMREGWVDAVVCDPPYGLEFMGKDWDHGVPGEHFWKEILRVAKPGAYLLAFGGTRTFHRLACAIEDAGWEIRDCVMWVYGSGFPKSLDVSKAIDKAAGVEREVLGRNPTWREAKRTNKIMEPVRGGSAEVLTAPATDAGKQWDGWGTALKPAFEPIIVARKPLIGTVAENVLAHGTGAINIDGCRVKGAPTHGSGASMSNNVYGKYSNVKVGHPNIVNCQGRWPANLVHDGGEEVLGLLGDAARFYYCAKASKSERSCYGRVDNKHPTVKPLALMRYLVRLVTPPGGVVLDPFMGSGSTGVAALQEGCNFIGIDKDPESVGVARQRLELVEK